jgi:hypothetical protein
VKARIYWSGWGWLGGNHSSEIAVVTSGDYSNPVATVSVLSEDANFVPHPVVWTQRSHAARGSSAA